MVKQRSRTVYVCSDCGEEYSQWQGRCSVCGNWNTLKEFTIASDGPKGGIAGAASSGSKQIVTRKRLSSVEGATIQRQSSGFSEFDRVLGGGFVPGEVLLIGGDPGIGKSTLLIQLAERFGGDVLYVSGEESAEQIKLRADRLGIKGEKIEIYSNTDVAQIQEAVEKQVPGLLVIDSIQTMYDASFPSTPGSIVQVRETALRLQLMAKRLGVTTVIVGHITKDGTVAGPRTLEHLVDAVCYLEGDPSHELRILRAVKNRFGDAMETGIFRMAQDGLVEVTNPGLILIEDRSTAAGSVLSCTMEGSRPVLVEVQALVVPTAFGTPRRTAAGFDLNRLNLLLAVLQRRAGVDLSGSDVYVNVVGGLRIKDPALDAAVCAALVSAKTDVSISKDIVIVGEVGLAGEIRKPTQLERRTREVENLGFQVQTGKELRSILPRRTGTK